MISILKSEFKRRMIDEGLSRIKQCLDILSEDEVWQKENINTNSVGNLVVHLCGNVRQYVISGIGGQEDFRVRDAEFSKEARVSKQELVSRIEETVYSANSIIQNIEQDALSNRIAVQGFSETTLSIIIHVIEHFSYHVGQITFFTKFKKDVDTGYYSGFDLNVTS